MKSINPKVLVVATSQNTRGGITSVVKAYKNSELWNEFHCKWIETHRDGSVLVKLSYLVKGILLFLLNIPFFNIVHVHISEPLSAIRKVFFVVVSKLLGKKVIVHFHSFSVETTIKGNFRSLYRYLFTKADIVLVLSKYWQREICETYGIETEKVKVLYNPCTTEVSGKVYQKRKELLYAGTINARKGYADLLKAFSLIADRHRDWQIVFAGNGEIGNGRKLATQLGIDKQVVFLGWVSGENKDKAFKQASVFCLPSYAEGFPMGVLDAWAYGLPVITTPVGGIPDIAIDGKNCLLFKPGDVNELALQLEKIISDDELRRHIAEESRKLALTTFHLDTINNQLGRIYASL